MYLSPKGHPCPKAQKGEMDKKGMSSSGQKEEKTWRLPN